MRFESTKKTKQPGIVILVLLLCVFFFFSSLVTYRVSVPIVMVAIALSLVLAVKSGKIMDFDLRSISLILPWLLVCAFAIISVAYGRALDLVAILALICVVWLAIVAASNDKWIKPTLNIFILVLSLFSVTTIVCYIFPNVYSSFIKPTFYPTVSMATDYRSGLASHYSHNGTFCAVGMLISSSLALYGNNTIKKQRLYGVVALVFFAALVLTTKRAHLLCCIFAVLFVYLISNKNLKYFKIAGIVILTAIFVMVLAPYIPGVEASINRLISTFSSNISFEENVNNRTFLWEAAISGFHLSPIFGNGWTSYYYIWSDGFTVSSMAHNEFLNLLYETGIVGTATVLIGCISILIATVKGFSSVSSKEHDAYLKVSLAIQLFFLAYGFTSGALFTVIPNLSCYFLAIAITLAVRWDERTMHLERERFEKGA